MRPLILFTLVIVAACAETSAIHLASSKESPFERAVYSGEATTITKTPAGVDEYRVFHQGGTGFVPLESVREEAERRADRFCQRTGKTMLPLREVASKPPHIFGNFPRVEFIFACMEHTVAIRAPRPLAPSSSTGTGFAVLNPSTIATAFHVIDGATSISLVCGGGQESAAVVDRIDPANDLALLKASTPASAHLELAAENSLVVGQRVFTVGFPLPSLLGSDAKFSDGSVSSLSGLLGAASLLQITVPIQPGSSGGPLMNEMGQLVAVVTSTAAVQGFLRKTGTLPQNVNWAVRGEYLRPLLVDAHRQQVAWRGSPVERAQRSVCLVKAVSGPPEQEP